MAFTHKFEIDILNEGSIEGELDFTNPNDGIKFTNVGTNLEMHIKCLQCIMSALMRVKEMSKDAEINKFTIEKII